MKTCRLCIAFPLLPLLNVLCCGKCTLAQAVPSQTVESRSPVYSIVPYDEDWSYLRNRALRSDWLDRIKYMPFGENESSYVSIG